MPRKAGRIPRYLSPDNRITPKQQRYAELLGTGLEPREAAMQAGFSKTYARSIKHRLRHLPAVAAATEGVQRKGRELAAYGLKEALEQAQQSIEFARLHKNPMAAVKGCELKAKLSGLLIDRVEVVSIDLSGSLAQAAQRVIAINPAYRQVLQSETQADQPAGDSFRYCGPGEEGNPFGAD